MDGPSLSEITNIKGDANIAGGSAGGADAPAPVAPSNTEGLQFLNEASQARAAYNKYLSDQYAQNLKDNISNLRNFDFSKALPADLPGLRQKYAQLASDYANNFDVVTNPASNPDKWAQLTQDEAGLRGDIAQSAGDNTIHSYNQKFLAENPTYNTHENQMKVANFEAQPMGQRTDYMLTTPTNFDMTKVAQMAAPYALKSIQQEQLSHDKNWINTTEGQQFSQDAFHNAAMSIKNNTIINGQTLNDAWMKDYNLLPANLKNGMTPDQAFLAGIDALAPQTSLKTTFKANPFAENQQRENFEAEQQARTQAFQADQNERDRLQRDKFQKKGEIDPDAVGEANLRTLAITRATGNIPANIAQTIYGNNNLVTKQVVIPVPDNPNLPKDEQTFDNKLKQTSTIKVPKSTFTNSQMDANGNLHLYFRDSQTGKALPAKVVTYHDLLNDLNGSYGNTFAPQIGAAVSKFSQKQFGKPIPTPEDLQKFYQLPNNTDAVAPVGSAAPPESEMHLNQPVNSTPTKKLTYNPATGKFE